MIKVDVYEVCVPDRSTVGIATGLREEDQEVVTFVGDWRAIADIAAVLDELEDGQTVRCQVEDHQILG